MAWAAFGKAEDVVTLTGSLPGRLVRLFLVAFLLWFCCKLRDFEQHLKDEDQSRLNPLTCASAVVSTFVVFRRHLQ